MICRPCKNGQHEKCDDVGREARFIAWQRDEAERLATEEVGPEPTGAERASMGGKLPRWYQRRAGLLNTLERLRPTRGCPCHHGED